MKFKEGDWVVVTNGDYYFITKNGSFGRVVEIRGSVIEVKFMRTTGEPSKDKLFNIIDEDLSPMTKLHAVIYGINLDTADKTE